MILPDELRGPVRALVAGLVEEVNADAVVVLWSQTDKTKTVAKMVTYGNQIACLGLVNEALEAFEEQQDENDSGDEDEDDDDGA